MYRQLVKYSRKCGHPLLLLGLVRHVVGKTKNDIIVA